MASQRRASDEAARHTSVIVTCCASAAIAASAHTRATPSIIACARAGRCRVCLCVFFLVFSRAPAFRRQPTFKLRIRLDYERGRRCGAKCARRIRVPSVPCASPPRRIAARRRPRHSRRANRHCASLPLASASRRSHTHTHTHMYTYICCVLALFARVVCAERDGRLRAAARRLRTNNVCATPRSLGATRPIACGVGRACARRFGPVAARCTGACARARRARRCRCQRRRRRQRRASRTRRRAHTATRTQPRVGTRHARTARRPATLSLVRPSPHSSTRATGLSCVCVYDMILSLL